MTTYPDFVDVYTYDYEPDYYDGTLSAPSAEYVNGNLTRTNFASNPTFIDIPSPDWDIQSAELRTGWSLTDGSSLYVGPNLRFTIWRYTPYYVQITGRYAGQKVYNSVQGVIAETSNTRKTLVITPEMADSGHIYLGEGYWDNHLQTLTASELGRVFKATDPERVIIHPWKPNISWDPLPVSSGVDRGVIFTDEGAVSWPGLVSVNTNNDAPPQKSLYQDGELTTIFPYPFYISGEIEAFSFPKEANQYLGLDSILPGLYGHGSAPRPFGLSYRTGLVDSNTPNHGYLIHIWYKVFGEPIETRFSTLSSSSDATPMSWKFKALPFTTGVGKKHSKLTIDSTVVSPKNLATLESILYGYDNNQARIPTPNEIVDILAAD